jgi:Heavy metal binding domain
MKATKGRAILFVLVVAPSILVFAQKARTVAPASPSSAASPASALPAISWSCPMHPDVLDDHKGQCPICKMTLVPVRLVAVWTCPIHGVIEQDHAGKCRICGRDLIQTTRALTFTCAGHPDSSQLEPGRCADGTPMTAKYSPRPHGDHNPRHGGLFFMAPDNWHHVEGTYPAPGQFRVYLYDDYTKPLPLAKARQVRARVVIKEVFDPATKSTRELSSAPLVLARNGTFLEARIDPLALPAQMTAKMSFMPDDKESRFDFAFPAYSKDVVAPPAPAQTSAPAVPAIAPGAEAAAPAATEAAGAAGGAEIDSAPTASLVSELKSQDEELAAMVKSGSYGAIYVPALKAKDLALEIQARQGSLKQEVETPVKQLVVAAYELDNYGDLGDSVKISGAYRDFAAAVSAIDSLLAARR